MTHLYTSEDLKQYRLIAADGELGSIDDYCIEQLNWVVRYLVVDSEKWLGNRKILVSPIAVGNIFDQDRTIDIELTKWQLEHSPVIEQKAVISRQYEDLYYKHLNWAPYWTATEAAPRSVATTDMASGQTNSGQRNDGGGYLKYESDLNGFEMYARGQKAGSLDGIVIDSYYWIVRYLVVDTQQWLSSRIVLLSPALIATTDWLNRDINVDVSHDVVASAPLYDESKPITRQYEIDLCKHYGLNYYGNGS